MLQLNSSKIHWRHSWPWLMGFVMFVSYSVLAHDYQIFPKYSSPDETANYYYTQRLITTGKMTAPQGNLPGWVLPRSFSLRNNQLVPASFLGLPYYAGNIGRVLGARSVQYFTPFLAAAAVVAFGFTLQRLTSHAIAIYSTLLFATQPVYWFYAARGFWHNGGFVSLLVIGVFFGTQYFLKRRWWYAAAAGFAFGVALTFRTNELIWVLPLLAGSIWVNRNLLNLRHGMVFGIALLIPFLPIFWLQHELHQGLLVGGYDNVILGQAASSSLLSRLLAAVGAIVAPFGWHPVTAIRAFFQYSFLYLFPLYGFAFLSALWSLRPSKRAAEPKWARYSMIFLGLSIWLMLYYGSYTFVEYVFDPTATLLGNSYLRYWLPLYILAAPLAARFLLTAIRLFPKAYHRHGTYIVFGLVIAIFIGRVTIDPAYGLLTTHRLTHGEYRGKWSAAQRSIPPGAVILAGSDDKIYWPEHAVVGFNYGSIPDAVLRNLSELMKERDVYYATDQTDEVSRVNKILERDGLRFTLTHSLTGATKFYKLQGNIKQ